MVPAPGDRPVPCVRSRDARKSREPVSSAKRSHSRGRARRLSATRRGEARRARHGFCFLHMGVWNLVRRSNRRARYNAKAMQLTNRQQREMAVHERSVTKEIERLRKVIEKAPCPWSTCCKTGKAAQRGRGWEPCWKAVALNWPKPEHTEEAQ